MSPPSKGQKDPKDKKARDLAINWTEGPVLVEAGAGTGKTDLLVKRVLHLVKNEGIDIERIVAITFTIKAAAELRGRVRAALTSEVEKEKDDRAGKSLRDALDRIDRAPISTIHSFALRLLQERPIEAGLRPGAGDVDQDAYDNLRDRVWEEWLRERMTAGDEALEMFLELGFGQKHLEDIRGALLELPELRGGFPEPVGLTVREIKEPVGSVIGEWSEFSSLHCEDQTDKGFQQLDGVMEWFEKLSDTDMADFIRGLWEPPTYPRTNSGAKKKWDSEESLEIFREDVTRFRTEVTKALAVAGHEVISGVAGSLAGYTDTLAARALEEGVLSYAGILHYAARLIRESDAVRNYFHGRYDHFLIDEFQDTDPLQAELIFRLAGDDGGAENWRNIKIGGGGLFVVGDPKQSIYRFRRADIAVYHEAKKLIENSPGGKSIPITENFRSAPGVTKWVNGVFSQLIQEQGAVQPGYEPLNAYREDEDLRVSLLKCEGAEAGEKLGADLFRHQEAAMIAGEIKKLIDSGRKIHPKGEDPRSVRPGDIVLLFRTRTGFSIYEEALRGLDIPVSSDGGSGFYETIEIAAAGAVLRAVANPEDSLAMAAALRSPLYGFSDVDLAGWRLFQKGSAGYPDEMEEAAAEIREMHEERGAVSPRAILEEIFNKTQAFELFLSVFDGERRMANLLKLLDIAFEFSGGGARGVDEFAAYLRRQLALGREAKESEETVADEGEEIGRMMTIHGSKGLEFPVVALADMGGGYMADEMSQITDRQSGRVHLKTGSSNRKLSSAGYAAAKEHEDAIQEAERRRLLYVAATRARDWLIVPEGQDGKGKNLWAILEEGIGGGAGDLMEEVVADAPEAFHEPEVSRLPEDAFEVDDAKVREQERDNEAVREALGRLGATSKSVRPVQPSLLPELVAGGVAQRWEEEDGDDRWGVSALEAEGAPGGKKFGELVHDLLARLTIYEVGAVSALDGVARGLAIGLGLGDKDAGEALSMITGALEMEIFRRAGRAGRAERVYRELPFLMIEGERLIRGVADLVFEEAGALVVVDFKTDAVSGSRVDGRAAHYRPQGTVYAMGVEAASGLPVSEVVFTFLRSGEQRAFEVDEVSKEAVRAALSQAD
ncbi:MAG: UvrD-helicase domain-containing protein [Nitrospinaceae bacterium]|nr:UvrD-helicase domain-containing protein [Nitrospinaceae bacterium]